MRFTHYLSLQPLFPVRGVSQRRGKLLFIWGCLKWHEASQWQQQYNAFLSGNWNFSEEGNNNRIKATVIKYFLIHTMWAGEFPPFLRAVLGAVEFQQLQTCAPSSHTQYSPLWPPFTLWEIFVSSPTLCRLIIVSLVYFPEYLSFITFYLLFVCMVFGWAFSFQLSSACLWVWYLGGACSWVCFGFVCF